MQSLLLYFNCRWTLFLSFLAIRLMTFRRYRIKTTTHAEAFLRKRKKIFKLHCVKVVEWLSIATLMSVKVVKDARHVEGISCIIYLCHLFQPKKKTFVTFNSQQWPSFTIFPHVPWITRLKCSVNLLIDGPAHYLTVRNATSANVHCTKCNMLLGLQYVNIHSFFFWDSIPFLEVTEELLTDSLWFRFILQNPHNWWKKEELYFLCKFSKL